MPIGKDKSKSGYTIVEVMIVLAISGVMFLIATTFINGKQEQGSFLQGVNTFTSDNQDVVEQIIDGRYSDIPLTCSFDGSTTSVTGGTSAQGTNQDCVFLGKMLVFTVGSANYEEHTIAGGRVDPITNAPITTLAGAHPADVAPTLVVQETIPDSLVVQKMQINGATVATAYAVGFYQGQGTTDGSGDLVSGAQPVSLYGAGISGGNIAFSTLVKLKSADLCLTDGQQYAEIIIGDKTNNSDQLNIVAQRDGFTKPAWC